ncbi:halocyanin domain-containing protein [Candidatus Halobonum tyrrellensis]|uniref:Halocyanin domain-containing protein n=1 Tax=Candidatus Halobonum tyrrellensis G22 TaxID=1324957 RepID=V4GTX3_9EURY|nr:halocyanin domain-containing protein [Candidatus Halobonum tyrrellensis]ESP88581.1 halocyanin domain-containing protein [Candidatus Halobonum tyrrellensis G22]
MSEPNGRTRRAVLAGVGATGLAALAGCASSAGGSDTPTGESEYGGWMRAVSNYEGETADRTGDSEVRVTVAPEGDYTYAPAAVAVSPGTTVVWEWTGGPTSHDVAEADGGYASDLHTSEDATFSHTFEEAGVSKYYCTPHRNLGMKGVVEVRGGDGGEG